MSKTEQSATSKISSDVGKLIDEWKELDPQLRFLDIMSVLGVVIFGISYIIINVTDVVLTVTNSALLIFPIIFAGYTYVFRSNLANPNKDNEKARKEYFSLLGIVFVLLILTIIYSYFLNNVL